MTHLPMWQRRRSAFNHDWLKNRYLPALHSWLRAIDGDLEAPQFEAEFLQQVLPDWARRREERDRLIGSFAQEMSPGTMVNDSDPWLVPLLNELWNRRTSATELSEACRGRAAAADACYDKLLEAVRGHARASAATGYADLRDRFRAFHLACIDVAKAIEVLPTRCEVV